MARVVVASSGISGGIRPFGIVARALGVRGHDVVEDVTPIEVRAGEAAERPSDRALRGNGPSRFARLTDLCRGADVLISGPDPVPALVARSSRVPHLCVVLEPASLAHIDYQPISSPPPRGRLRALASSAHFSVPDLTLYEDLRVTGFIFAERVTEPPMSTALDAWLAAGSDPIVLSMGTLPEADADSLARVACEAAALVGRRLVIQAGGSHVQARSLAHADAVIAGLEPHAALFSRAAAVIHDGGIGTTSEALRQGRPMLLLPRRQAQFFNARAVRRLGVGTAMHREGIGAGPLAQVLAERVIAAETCGRAVTLARKLATDDGLGAVCSLAEWTAAGP